MILLTRNDQSGKTYRINSIWLRAAKVEHDCYRAQVSFKGNENVLSSGSIDGCTTL
jgi:hypothetical protein